MARTLPWLSNGAPTATTKSSTTKPINSPSKRQRVLDPSSQDNLPSPSVPAPIPRRTTAISHPPRTPSTSPPPSPPTESPMRPGLSADDIYIMVEDEFLSTARTFTQHLHHAEYTRLKRLAQKNHQNSSNISNTITRPTDSITTMRAETKKRKDAEAKEMRTKAVLEKLNGGGRGRLRGESESGSDLEGLEEEEDRGDAPWSGTVLQSFMITSPRKAGTISLTGLDGVKSSTRAAAGYSKPVAKEGRKVFDLAPRGGGDCERANVEAVEDAGSTEDDDDLDAPLRVPHRPTLPTTQKIPESPTRKAADSVSRRAIAKPPPPPPPRYPTQTRKQTPIPTSSSSCLAPAPSETLSPKPLKRATFDLDSADPRARSQEMSEAARRRLRARRERERRDGRGELGGGGGGGVSEIPTFLV